MTAEAFRLLFESNGEALTLYVERMVRSPHVAADLVQDVFLRLWRGRAQLDIRGDVRGYLRRMARNRALDWLRREQLRVQWERTAEVEVRAWSESSTDHERFALLSQVLGELLAAMPERRRRVCEMRWNEGLGPAVIAQRLGLSLKTVETHITRALKDVRAEVAQRQLVS